MDSTGLHFRKNPEFFCAPLAGALVNLAEGGEGRLIPPPPFAGPLGRAEHSRYVSGLKACTITIWSLTVGQMGA